MKRGIDQRVRDRASLRCEYCLVPQFALVTPFQIDHVIALKHEGKTSLGNLALACYSCNQFKGDNIAGIDPDSNQIVRLFHPRRHKWTKHFEYHGPMLVGRTAIGRTTIQVLKVNLPYRIRLRQELIEEGAISSD